MSAALRNLLQPLEPDGDEVGVACGGADGGENGASASGRRLFTLSASGVTQLVSELLLPARASGLLATGVPLDLIKLVLTALSGLMAEGAGKALDEESEVRAAVAGPCDGGGG